MPEQPIHRDLPNPLNDVPSVAGCFHLDGAWASPASFTFPLATFVPLEESLGDLRDLVTRSW